MADGCEELTGQVTLITGASSGIGAATAILFSKLGAKLALSGRNEANLNRTATECKKQPGANMPFLILGDLTNEADSKNIIDSTIEHYGKVDILVNNAGIQEVGSIEQTSLEQYDRVMGTNVRSTLHLTMLAVPHLILSKGNIVNVSSILGLRPVPNMLTYGMSKSTIDQFTRCLALELAPRQVRVNSVSPGLIVTELQKRAGLSDERYAELLEHCKTTHALGRPGEPEEVAAAIAFLASNSASFITGVQLPVDGGRHAMSPR